MNEHVARAPLAGSKLRNRYLLLLDAVLLPLATVAAFAIRFEGTSWGREYDLVLSSFVALALPLKLLVMWRLKLYARLWRYASVRDLEVLSVALLGGAFVSLAIGIVVVPLLGTSTPRMPFSVVVLDALLAAVAVGLPRLLVRMGTARVGAVRMRRAAGPVKSRRALVVGAGAAGAMIVRELLENPVLELVPVAVLDDDSSKHGRQLHGVPVAGPLAELGSVVSRMQIDEIIIAMPSVPGKVVRALVSMAQQAGVPTRTVPGVYELIDGRKSVSALRKVAIEDLLRREPVHTDLARVRTLARDKTVLVTGAGGSIGGELCRQLARLEPTRIVALGRGENSIFELLQDLHRVAPDVQVEPVIADIRDAARIERVFRTFRPHTVFHAAAHKHVPLMELNVAEAILNNVHGTRVIAEESWRSGVTHFVLISSDKAVRPSSVMGATKRLAEGVVQRYGSRERPFVSVRFGNVLGSRGSVIPTFLRQIQAGGPVTITHTEMRRYFMTIPEAVQLVLQAGTMAAGGEVFVLDMGEPVRIYDLAHDLIRLSGLEAGADIEIQVTGTRPGEKLYEELFFDAEHAVATAHPKVLRARNAALENGAANGAGDAIDELIALARRNAPAEELRAAIKMIVPEYTGADAPKPTTMSDGGPQATPQTAPPRASWREKGSASVDGVAALAPSAP